MQKNRKKICGSLLPAAIAAALSGPVSAMGKGEEDSVFTWGRWRSLAPAGGGAVDIEPPVDLEPVARPEDAQEYARSVRSLAQTAPVPTPGSSPSPEDEESATAVEPTSPPEPPAWQGCDPGAQCLYSLYSYRIQTGKAGEERTDEQGGSEPAWVEALNYSLEEIDDDENTARASAAVRPWKETGNYRPLSFPEMAGDYERKSSSRIEIDVHRYEYEQAEDLHEGETDHAQGWGLDFETDPVPSSQPGTPPFLRGRWAWFENKEGGAGDDGASSWEELFDRWGYFVGGETTSLQEIEALMAGGVVAHYGDAAVTLDVDFAASTWQGSWYGGMDAYDPDFGIRFAEVWEDGRGVSYLRNVDMGFEAKGHIEGVNFVSDEITAKDAASISGSVHGSFFGPDAAAVGGIADVTKTVTDESAAAVRDGRAFTYENARQVRTFFLRRADR